MNKLSRIKGIVNRKTLVSETDHPSPGDHAATGAVRNYYKITVGTHTFNAAEKLGKKVNPGQEFAFVIDRSNTLLLKNLDSGKIYGAGGPWLLILTGVATMLFNSFAIPAFLKDPENNLAGLAGLNAFLILMLVYFIYDYAKMRKALRLLS